jgi:predicted ester cyclase
MSDPISFRSRKLACPSLPAMIWSCRAAWRPRRLPASSQWPRRAMDRSRVMGDGCRYPTKMEARHVDNQQALRLLHRYHDATNTRRLGELDDIFAKDFINFAAGFEPVKSLAAMKKLIQELLLAFPDWHVTVEDMFAQDNKVVTRWSLAATQLARYRDIPATGLKIHAEGIHIDHIVGDKIAKRWACNNFTEVFNKLRAHAKT